MWLLLSIIRTLQKGNNIANVSFEIFTILTRIEFDIRIVLLLAMLVSHSQLYNIRGSLSYNLPTQNKTVAERKKNRFNICVFFGLVWIDLWSVFFPASIPWWHPAMSARPLPLGTYWFLSRFTLSVSLPCILNTNNLWFAGYFGHT